MKYYNLYIMENQIINKLNDKLYKSNNHILLDLISIIKNIISDINNNKKSLTIIKQLKGIILIMNKIIDEEILTKINKYNKINYNDSKYIGELKDGERDGKGIYYYNAGDRYEGDFKKGLFDGKGVFYCNNGDKYVGEMKNGICDGKGILYFKSGSKYDGEFKNDKREGKGIYYYNNGDRYEGEWKNDKREGNGIMYYYNDDREMGDYIDGKERGMHVTLHANGKVTTKMYH